MVDDLLIHELGPKGDGVHRSQRERIYVDRGLPGDVIQAKVARDAEGILRGDLLKVLKPSAHRVKAPCPNYEVCGGCTVQHANAAFYKNWKIEIVREALRKKGLEPKFWRAPVFLPAGGRRRATFTAYKKNNRITLGHFRRRGRDVTDIATCLIVDPAIMDLRARLVSLLVPIVAEGNTVSVFMQTVGGQFEIVLTGPIGKTGKPDAPVREAIAQLARQAKINRVAWRNGMDDAIEVMVEINPLRAMFGTLEVALPPYAFLQPTQAGEAALVDAVMAALPKTGKFADLFSGCGTFTGPMLERGPVDAFESVGPAIRALDKAKGTRPLKAIRRDLFRNPLRRDETNRYDAVVFDPPRAGAEEQVTSLASGRTPTLIGVSCNPTTFARDARILVDGGYRLDSVTVVDQFTWSHHVELVAAFSKRGNGGPRGRRPLRPLKPRKKKR